MGKGGSGFEEGRKDPPSPGTSPAAYRCWRGDAVIGPRPRLPNIDGGSGRRACTWTPRGRYPASMTRPAGSAWLTVRRSGVRLVGKVAAGPAVRRATLRTGTGEDQDG